MDFTVNSQVVPQYMIRYKNLSNDAMRSNCLKRHLQTKHPRHKNKLLAFFQSKKKDCLKKLKLAS